MDFKDILKQIFVMLDVYDGDKRKDTSFEKKAIFVYYCGQTINLLLETFQLDCEYFYAELSMQDSF
jgi:hypothetical protein